MRGKTAQGGSAEGGGGPAGGTARGARRGRHPGAVPGRRIGPRSAALSARPLQGLGGHGTPTSRPPPLEHFFYNSLDKPILTCYHHLCLPLFARLHSEPPLKHRRPGPSDAVSRYAERIDPPPENRYCQSRPPSGPEALSHRPSPRFRGALRVHVFYRCHRQKTCTWRIATDKKRAPQTANGRRPTRYGAGVRLLKTPRFPSRHLLGGGREVRPRARRRDRRATTGTAERHPRDRRDRCARLRPPKRLP